MADFPDFIELHERSHERLALQALALTGDPHAAAAGVREAFIAASQHWKKVSLLADPEEWVRSRAWSMATRRHLTHPWHRDDRVTPEQSAVLRSLQQLRDTQRRALLLHHLAGQSASDIAAELGLTQTQCAQALQDAVDAYTRALQITGDQVLASLQQLQPLVELSQTPTADQLIRKGARRRVTALVLGCVGSVTLVLLAGYFVSSGHVAPVSDSAPDSKPVTQSMLLTEKQLSTFTPVQPWTITSTNDNTSGTGINSTCQGDRFADPDGVGTLVRKFNSPGVQPRTLVETVEISDNPTKARDAYETTRGWFAGCELARLQLTQAWQINDLGEQAELIAFRVLSEPAQNLMVGLVRSGSVTVSTVMDAQAGAQIDPQASANLLNEALGRLCKSTAAKAKCSYQSVLVAANPPRSGEPDGSLSAVDLPPVAKISAPWMGSDLLPGEPNVASTPCDNTSFVAAGATDARTRSYLIPQAGLPARFGVTETFARLPNQARARKAINTAFNKMTVCEKDILGTKVTQAKVQRKAGANSEYGLWRVESQINNQQETIQWWMGIIRVGSSLAQVNFAPVGVNDIDQAIFTALVERARDRLYELEPDAPNAAQDGNSVATPSTAAPPSPNK